MSGDIRKYQRNKGYESINRSMLQDTENLSLQAIGLLSYLTSLPEGWALHKTELYTRFNKNGKSSVMTSWNNLIDAGYIIQFKIREGKAFTYKYYHFHEPFTAKDIAIIEQEEGYSVWDGTRENSSVKLLDDKSVTLCESGEKSSISENQNSNVSNAENRNPKSSISGFELPKISIYKVLHKEIKDLDTLDTSDTGKSDYPQSTVDKSDFQHTSIPTKEDYMKKAYIENEEHIPKRIAIMLQAFSESFTQANKYYSIILQAKNKVEKDFDFLIWFEHEPEIEAKVITAFSRAMIKIEKERVVENVNGYLYRAVYQAIANEVMLQRAVSTEESESLDDIYSFNYETDEHLE